MKKIIIPIIAGLLLSSTVFAQRTERFKTSFEYGSLDAEPISVREPSELNGANDQVGTWGGDLVPDGSGGDIIDPPEDPIGFKNNPYDGGRLLVLDRPGPDPDLGDFKGHIDALLTDPVVNIGAEVSFQLGTRRTGGNNNKDYDIVGRDSDGNESFRLRVDTNNNDPGSRLCYVTDDGATVECDLPTVVGDDGFDDMNNTGYNATLVGPYEDDLGGPGVNAEFASILVRLGSDGWSIDFALDPANNAPRAYTSDTLPYNGPATELALVEFGYSGTSGTGANSGWFLDNVVISGFDEFVQGDFDLSGEVDFADFLILSTNFGEITDQGDYDLNGVVNLADFKGLKAAFQAANAPAGAAAVPEPGSLCLVALGFTGLLARRRRR